MINFSLPYLYPNVSNITNAEGSAKILTELVERLEGNGAGGTEDITFCGDTVKEIVEKVNRDASNIKRWMY